MDNVQVLTTVLLLYLAIGTNFLKELFSCELQYILNNSVMMKNILGILVLYYCIVSTTIMPGEHPVKQLMASVALYLVFFLTTRCDYRFILALFVAGVVIQFIVSVQQYNQAKKKDQAKKEEDQEQQEVDRDGDAGFRGTANRYLVPFLAVLLVMGVVGYVGYKYISIRRGTGGVAAVRAFDWRSFIVGVPSCPSGVDVNMYMDDSVAANIAEGAQVIRGAILSDVR